MKKHDFIESDATATVNETGPQQPLALAEEQGTCVMAKNSLNHAIPVTVGPSNTVAEKITLARAHINALKNNPNLPAAKEVQDAAAAWSAETDNMEASAVKVKDLENDLKAERANQKKIHRRWAARKRGMLSAVNNTCDGSKDEIASYGFGVFAKGSHITATVPENLSKRRSNTPGAAEVAWTPQDNVRGYMIQYATDPADASTYSQPISCSKASFKLTGQTPGATIYFRVLALDATLPTGQTEYTAWVAAMVSV